MLLDSAVARVTYAGGRYEPRKLGRESVELSNLAGALVGDFTDAAEELPRRCPVRAVFDDRPTHMPPDAGSPEARLLDRPQASAPPSSRQLELVSPASAGSVPA